MTKRLLWAVVIALLPVAALADNPNPSFYLVNHANQAINELYVSPVSARGWGRDQLGDDTVDAGANAPIRLHADGNCMFDLRVVYEDGRHEERRGVNTCTVDNITFGDTGCGDDPAPRSSDPAPRGSDNSSPSRDPTFRVVNNGRREIQELYARQVGSSSWGRDRLGDDTVDVNADIVIHLPSGQCMWDVRVVFGDGRAVEKRRLNLCQINDLTVP